MDPTLENVDTEMSPWATRRKAIILGAAVLVLTGISFAVFWKFWYAAPTCSDKLQNGDETGVDCGGSCSAVCGGEAVRPIVRWDPRIFEVSPGVWSALVYVENPNPGLDATYLPYTFTFYGGDNSVLEERKGVTILPKGKIVGVFESSITFKDGARPKRATFEIGKDTAWEKSIVTDELKITHGALLKLDSAPRVEATVKNTGIEELKDIELVIAIFDGSDNAIAASRTFLETLKKNESAQVVFTWPKPFDLGSKICDKSSDVMLLLDRSGSMASQVTGTSTSLSLAKSAAVSFVDQMGSKDKIGVVSFASEPKEPLDLSLTSDLKSVPKAIQSIVIESGATQYTNIFGALHAGWQELVSGRAEDNSSKIMILLTDGVANKPGNPGGRTEAEDIQYAEKLALKEAADAKKDGVTVYTIGLGKKINETFLKSAASAEDHYFFAPSAKDLEAIYKNISSEICQEVPARIEITYKVFGREGI